MKTETYRLPEFWAVPLMYGDYGGLEDQDIQDIEDWYEFMNPGRCVDVDGDIQFSAYHDASGYVLACHTVLFTFITD